MKGLNSIYYVTRNLCRIILTSMLLVTFALAMPNPSEENELVSFAQDLFRQQGVNLPRSAFSFKVTRQDDRVFMYKMLTRYSTQSADLLQAFQIAGAVSQHAAKPIDNIVVIAQVEFAVHEPMTLWASGDCCEKLYNNRLSPEVFTEGCLRIEQ